MASTPAFQQAHWLGFLLLILWGACQHTGSGSTADELPLRASMKEIEAGIRAYIQQETDAGNGYFHIQDGERELRLKLVRVHTEYLSNLGPGKYFACVDLADMSGDVFDVDFFLEGTPGAMHVTEWTLHKLNGKPFYTWKQASDKTWYRVSIENASRDLLGIVEKEDQFTFYYHAEIPALENPTKLWVPLASPDAYQDVEVLSVKAPGAYRIIRESRFGNQVLYSELSPADTGAPVEIVYRVLRREKSAYADAATLPGDFLGADRLVPVGGIFGELAEEILAELPNPDDLHRARALYDYIIDNMRYMKFGDYGRGDAQYACDTRTGNCTEFHSFFISLARSAGIPARFSIGVSIPSDRHEGGIDGYHCWAEFYADGQWWPVDISEGNKYSALATYYFGRHPANRLEISQGRDLLVEPGPGDGPINFLVYPLLEEQGHTTTVIPSLSFERIVDPL